ncbi:MAG: saccharopine dehydrogenase C-terminal domain-containing protein [Bacillota bacterium]|jgi:lysine 6-dehydrogenase
MSSVLVLGLGLMGPAVARDLLKFELADRVVLADLDPKRVGRTVEELGSGRCEGIVVDLRDRRGLVEAMGRVDVVAGAYPVAAVREVTEAVIEAGVHLCDLTGSAEAFNIFDYHEAALKAGVAILPGCGLAPGLSNALVGQGAARLDRVEEGVIYVGGLPAKPLPPLEYRVVFSLDTVIEEYVAPALIVKDGVTTEAPALDGLEDVVFPQPVGRCEAFLTYGLGTLAMTGPELGFRNLAEKTVRYPGHRDKMALLRDCGFFSTTPVEVDGAAVVPRRLAAAVLTPLLQRGDPADVSVLRVVVRGEKNGRPAGWVFEMVDFYDPSVPETSMARTTGYTCSIVAGLLLSGRIRARGVAPLERIFADPGLYAEFHEALSRRGMVVRESRLGPGSGPEGT